MTSWSLKRRIFKVRFDARGNLLKKQSTFYSSVPSQIGLRMVIFMPIIQNINVISQTDVSAAFIHGRLSHYVHLA